MAATPLTSLREYVERLASETGEYRLVCGRTGHRPVPAAGLRFESRQAAQIAARVTTQYRATLRHYDPRLPVYDIIVCQDTASEQRVGGEQALREGQP
jgi:hypothetical protein